VVTLFAQGIEELERDLPEGLLVDASWLQKRGYLGGGAAATS